VVCRFLVRANCQGWHAKRESTDEYNTDAPNFDRGTAAAAYDPRPVQHTRSGRAGSGIVGADRHLYPDCAAAGTAETQGRSEAREKGGPEASEGQEEGEEIREGSFPPSSQFQAQEDSAQGRGAQGGEEEALAGC
jgi:hypothetical protein